MESSKIKGDGDTALKEALAERTNRLSRLKSKSEQRESSIDELRKKFKWKNSTKFNERPDIVHPRNFEEFLEKYPICNKIHYGQVYGHPLTEEGLIDLILKFFKDQDIDNYAFKICMGKFKGGNKGPVTETQLNNLEIKHLRMIPKRIYDCYYEGDTRVPSTFKASNNKKRKSIKKRKKKKTMKGGYPFWHDDVPKGITREQYKRLEKTKPKNKSMKVWIRENKKNMKKYTKKRKKKTYTKKRTRKNNIQKGGFCPPCLIAPIAAAAGLSTAGYMVSKSSSSSNINGKKSFNRKESYSIKKNGKPIKKVYEQKNNQIYLNGKEIKPRSKDINEATKRLNKKIKECLKSGFKKC